MKEKTLERSIISPAYAIAALVFFIGLAVYVYFSVSVAMKRGIFPITDYIIQAAGLFFLVNFCKATYEYELTDDALIINEKSLFSNKHFEIPYEEINGLHYFKNKLIKPISYRYTYRMYSKLDGRTIWSLVYNIPGKKGNKTGRILMKASEEFLETFAARVPDRIRISEAEVVAYTYKREEMRLRQEGYFEDVPETDVKDAARQLEQVADTEEHKSKGSKTADKEA